MTTTLANFTEEDPMWNLMSSRLLVLMQIHGFGESSTTLLTSVGESGARKLIRIETGAG